ncbi:alpha/beta fold hydrolase [Scytonema sp. PCC 10023]|uniref:alpha/beta fold hydrolase n=1 Tax=Scytonema sp. PCC 10023 TaxID=1680591 RepID=UPI0039C5C811
MNEKILNVNGVEICTESFGNPQNPTILLMMGATASMIWWDEEFCHRLADQKRFVIRYDNRDTGRSTVYEPGTSQYVIEDLADDAVGILDAYGINQAHLVGMSLGGMIAQIIALRYSQRVLTLSAIASSVFSDNPDLPPIDQKVLDYHINATSVNWLDEKTAIKYMVGGWRLLNGTQHPFDEQRTYKLAKTEVKRANNLPSMFNHALLQGGEVYLDRSNDINVPTLVIHGTEDPVSPYQHGIALANEIPKATLLTLTGAGHEIHFAEWDTIIDAIIKHTG